MGEAFQRLDCGLHQPVAGLAVHVGDQAEATAVFFEVGSVQTSLVMDGLGHGSCLCGVGARSRTTPPATERSPLPTPGAPSSRPQKKGRNILPMRKGRRKQKILRGPLRS